MQSSTPCVNLLVLRTPDIHRSVLFYQALGLEFVLHQHGRGPMHFSVNSGEVVLEIYPARKEAEITTHLRMGFRVISLVHTMAALEKLAVKVVSEPTKSEWGLRAVVEDLDGNTIELVSSLVTS